MADEALFSIRLVTPERVLVDGIGSEVILRTGEGDITFLAGSAPVVGTVEPGVVRIVGAGGEVERNAVHGGFVHVEQHVAAAGVAGEDRQPTSGTRVTILAGIAERAEEIDADRARAAHDVAESKVAELLGSVGRGSGSTGSGDADVVDPELVEARSALVRSEVRLEAIEAPVSAST